MNSARRSTCCEGERGYYLGVSPDGWVGIAACYSSATYSVNYSGRGGEAAQTEGDRCAATRRVTPMMMREQGAAWK